MDFWWVASDVQAAEPEKVRRHTERDELGQAMPVARYSDYTKIHVVQRPGPAARPLAASFCAALLCVPPPPALSLCASSVVRRRDWVGCCRVQNFQVEERGREGNIL